MEETYSYNDIKNLKKNYSDGSKVFLIEGENVIDEIPTEFIVEFFVSKTYAEKNKTRTNKPITILKDSLFASVSSNKTPQGRIAVCRKPVLDIHRHSVGSPLAVRAELIFILCGIADPGNLGAVIRAADACLSAAVLTTKGTVGIYNPKTVQAARGALFRVAISENIDHSDIEAFKGIYKLYAATPRMGTDIYKANLKDKCAVLIGNEARGLSASEIALADRQIRIPMSGGAESLNVAQVCAVIAYEKNRQNCIDSHLTS